MARGRESGFVCVGQFGAPHGIRGDVRLKSFTEKPETLKTFSRFYLEGDFNSLELAFKHAAGQGFVVSVRNLTTPELAGTLKGKRVFVKRGDLPPAKDGELYLADLEGMAVLTPKGNALGRVEKIYDFGAGPVLEIALEEALKGYGETMMIPFQGPAIEKVDLVKGQILFDLEAWLADEEEE